jgi:hypothetical protein
LHFMLFNSHISFCNLTLEYKIFYVTFTRNKNYFGMTDTWYNNRFNTEFLQYFLFFIF